jgi:hypothetical protein
MLFAGTTYAYDTDKVSGTSAWNNKRCLSDR